tara:strand:- start:62 stop:544 length:483 start_codon:yes stop_codon:yes gene_type:complete
MKRKGKTTNINPEHIESFGFETKSDGRIRGGIKTPEFFIGNKIPVKPFDIFESGKEIARPIARGNGRRLMRIHPLDIARAGRTIGQTIFDPISSKWKIDDGRPRGLFEDEITGERNWACWGKCKTKSRQGWFGGKTKAACPCNKGVDQCVCDGCMDNTPC